MKTLGFCIIAAEELWRNSNEVSAPALFAFVAAIVAATLCEDSRHA